MRKNPYTESLARRLKTRMEAREAVRRRIIADIHGIAKALPSMYPSLARIVLTGSVISGNFTEESDVDIVVSGLRKDDYFSCHSYLESKLGRKIDLIMEDDLSESDKKHVMTKTEIIYDSEKC